MGAINDNLGDFNLSVENVRAASSVGGIYTGKESQIYAGPPRYSMLQAAPKMYGIASVDVVRIDQQSAINSSAGVGSPIITWTGRASVGAGFGRTVFNVPSLLRALYSYYPVSSLGPELADLSQYQVSTFRSGNEDVSFPDFENQNLENHPGYRNLAFNLGSALYNFPFGLLIVMKTQTQDSDDVVGYFLAEARIRSHSLQIVGPSSMVSEEVSIVATSFHPVAM